MCASQKIRFIFLSLCDAITFWLSSSTYTVQSEDRVSEPTYHLYLVTLVIPVVLREIKTSSIATLGVLMQTLNVGVRGLQVLQPTRS